jgi:predicted nucleic acid-binding protein
MSTLVDTSILTRSAHPTDPAHQLALDAVAALRRKNEELCIAPQNLYEFWVVATRPAAQNGLGMTVAEAQMKLDDFKQFFKLLDDTPAIFPEWQRLVTHYQVVGKNGHDARLVAAMNVHGVNRILTFNLQDFQRYQGIVVVSPQQVLAAP